MMCKSDLSFNTETFGQSSSVEGLREYNTSTGTILVVGEKNQDFYTWYGSSRTPRKIDTVIQGNFGQNTEKRKRRKRNREKRKKKGKKGKNEKGKK